MSEIHNLRRQFSGNGHYKKYNDDITRWVPKENFAEGQRNVALTKLYGGYLKHDPVKAYYLIHLANLQCCLPPLSDKELDTIIKSINAREFNKKGYH